jgi:VCBS repeat-containing protein
MKTMAILTYNDVQRVSVTQDGTEGDGYSVEATISANGEYVVMRSEAHNLVTPDSNPYSDILLKNLATGEIVLASSTTSGVQANGGCKHPSVSADGQKILFSSWAQNLADGAPARGESIYVKDVGTQTLTMIVASGEGGVISSDGRYVAYVDYQDWQVHIAPSDGGSSSIVSTAADGTTANDWCDMPSISADGHYVAFATDATNLGAGNTSSGTRDIFVKNTVTGEVEWVSAAADGSEANQESGMATISADGRHVVFTSHASDIIPGVMGGAIFWKDMDTHEVKLVAQGVAAFENLRPTLSADGRYVSFASYASDLVEGDTNNAIDVFVKDMDTGHAARLSANADGEQGNAISFNPTISADGSRVAFYSLASNLVTGDHNATIDSFVVETAGPLEDASNTGVAIGADSPSTSHAVQKISQTQDGTASNSNTTAAVISSDGRYAAFISDASNLVANDTNGVDDVFVKNLETGAVVRVSTAADGAQANADTDHRISLSGDGQRVVFTSQASNLVAGENSTGALLLKDLGNQSVTVIAGNGDDGVISSDGQHVAYISQDDRQVYIAPASGGTPLLVSADADGVAGNEECKCVSVSADGHYVAFVSWATNLVAGSSNVEAAAFVKNTVTGAIERVITPAGGAGTSLPFTNVVISGDGRHVAFTSMASDILTGVTDAAVYWKDLDTHEVKLVTTGVAALDGGFKPAISADGRYVTFSSYATDLVEGDTNNSIDVFLKDMDSGTVTRLSTSAGGIQGDAISANPAISGDGSKVAFISLADNLVAGDGNEAIDAFVVSAFVPVGAGGANHTPAADAITGTIAEDVTGSINLLEASNASDIDGDVLSVVNPDASVTTTGGRTLHLGTDYTVDADGNAALTAAGAAVFNSLKAGETDTGVFHYGVTDGASTTAGTVTLTVQGVNDAPVVSGPVNLPQGFQGKPYVITTLDLLLNAVDVDSDTLSVTNLTVTGASARDNLDGTWTATASPSRSATRTASAAARPSASISSTSTKRRSP